MLDDAGGWRLAEMRKRRGMTQEQVAIRMGISVARVSQIENGDVVCTMDCLHTHPGQLACSAASVPRLDSHLMYVRLPR